MRETSIEVSGKTEDEAIQHALAQIGLDRDEVSVEIVRRAKSGLLGLGGTPAVVKVTYMTDAPEPPQTVTELPVKAKKASAKEKAPKAAAATHTEEMANRFLTGLLDKMGIAATPEIREEDGTLYIELVGPNMGAVIGRRGETLDAIQHLTSYAVNRGAEKRTRIYVDAENYRKKREDILVRLAHKHAEKAVRYRKSVGLEPMNAYERHVIHTALQDTPQVTTYSSGTEPNRRVFVAYDRAKRGTGAPQTKPIDREEQSPPSAPPTSSDYKEWA